MSCGILAGAVFVDRAGVRLAEEETAATALRRAQAHQLHGRGTDAAGHVVRDVLASAQDHERRRGKDAGGEQGQVLPGQGRSALAAACAATAAGGDGFAHAPCMEQNGPLGKAAGAASGRRRKRALHRRGCGGIRGDAHRTVVGAFSR